MSVIRTVRWSGAALAVALLSGCAGIKPYQNYAVKNVEIRTKVESGSVLSSVTALLNVYRLGSSCRPTYIGTVDLKNPHVAIGLHVGRPVLLMFQFDSDNWFFHSSESLDDKAVLSPRVGYRYLIAVYYVKDVYSVRIKEKAPGRGSRWQRVRVESDHCAGSNARTQ